MKPPIKIILTEARLLAGMKAGRGLKHKQANLLGVPWPLRSGWKHRVLGTLVDEEAYFEFLGEPSTCGVTHHPKKSAPTFSKKPRHTQKIHIPIVLVPNEFHIDPDFVAQHLDQFGEDDAPPW